MFRFLSGRAVRSVGLCFLLVLAAACGAAPAPTPSPAPSSSPSPTPAPSPSPQPATLLIEVTSEGGFINPAARIGQLPIVVVDADGRIYMPSPDNSDGLIPVVEMRDVGEAGAAAILAAIRAAGLDQAGDDGGVVTDAGVTIFTVQIDGQQIVNRVTGAAPGGPGHPGGESPALAFLNQLTDPSETWGATNVTTATYEPVAYRVYFAPAAATTDTMDWPLATSLADFGSPATPDFGVTGLRSGIVLGTDAQTLATALSEATSQEIFKSGGDDYQVWVRPLLPDEIA